MTRGRMLSPKEAAARLDRHRDTIRRWLKAGVLIGIQPFGPGGRIEIPEEEVDRVGRRPVARDDLD